MIGFINPTYHQLASSRFVVGCSKSDYKLLSRLCDRYYDRETAEATDQTNGHYLLEIDRSNDHSTDRRNFSVDRFYNFGRCTSIARITFLSFELVFFFN